MINPNTIICGDNLQTLKKLPSLSVNLAYLDPPFGESCSFDAGGVSPKGSSALVEMLRPRIREIHRLLASDGSLFFQIDWRTEKCIQVLLDKVFGEKNLIAKIIWQRSKPTAISRFVPHVYDVILFYGKTQGVKYYPQYLPYSESDIEDRYKYVEPETGARYRLVSLVSHDSERSRPTFDFLGVTRAWRISKEKMEEEYKQGRIVQSKPGAVPMRKQYISEGIVVGDIWSDVPMNPTSEAKTGYPTQRPTALLERIVKMSTQKGDLVLDPFCGSGTTLVVAEELGRKWIGIDVSPTACQIANQRLSLQHKTETASSLFQFQDSRTLREIREMPHYEFENWVMASLKRTLLENPSFGPSKGLDSASSLRVYSATKDPGFDMELVGQSISVPVMAKPKERIEAKEISNFAVQMKHYGRKKGFFVAFSFSRAALDEMKKKQEEGSEIIPIRAKELILETT
jgi:DNA modification methylase